MFNHFHVGSNLASKIPNGKIPFNTYLRKNVANSFFINPVQESEIEKLINNFSKIKFLVHVASFFSRRYISGGTQNCRSDFYHFKKRSSTFV